MADDAWLVMIAAPPLADVVAAAGDADEAADVRDETRSSPDLPVSTIRRAVVSGAVGDDTSAMPAINGPLITSSGAAPSAAYGQLSAWAVEPAFCWKGAKKARSARLVPFSGSRTM